MSQRKALLAVFFVFHYISLMWFRSLSQNRKDRATGYSTAKHAKISCIKKYAIHFLLLLPLQSTYTKMYLTTHKKRFGIVGLQYRYTTKVWWKSLDIFCSRFWLRFYLQWWKNKWAGRRSIIKERTWWNSMVFW